MVDEDIWELITGDEREEVLKDQMISSKMTKNLWRLKKNPGVYFAEGYPDAK